MPKDKKDSGHILHPIRVYGLNALLGFGLGVVIVLITFLVFGQSGAGGTETKGKNVNNPNNTTHYQPNQEQVKDGNQGVNSKRLDEAVGVGEQNNSEGLEIKDRFTVLLVGMDNRPGEKYVSNTDSLIVASFDQKNKKMVLLSIPRDTQVVFPNKTKEKVNSLARLGQGIPSTKLYIQDLIGNPINGYVATNFQGFKSIVDSLGGITINVEKNMRYDTGDTQDRYIDLKKGLQRMNGTQALQYARFRNDELADISRTTRQQEVLKAVVNEATATRNLPKIPFLIPKIYQSIETDLNLSQLWALATTLKNREAYEVVNQTLPGKFSIEEGISYWKVNTKESREILPLLFQGKKTSVFGSKSSTQPKIPSNKGEAMSLEEPKKEGANKLVKGESEVQDKQPGITFEVIGH
jgi:polyisoprenyl-teichoic acid--peptidoglycan teichoic acid transferase